MEVVRLKESQKMNSCEYLTKEEYRMLYSYGRMEWGKQHHKNQVFQREDSQKF